MELELHKVFNSLKLNKEEIELSENDYDYCLSMAKNKSYLEYDNVTKKYIPKNFEECEFKGFLELNYNPEIDYCSYYGFVSINEDKIYFPILYRYDTRSIASEEFQYNEYLNELTKKYNKSDITNEKLYREEIKQLFLPDINISTYSKDYPYTIYILGCDDGSSLFRFKNKEERENFISECLDYNNGNELIYPEYYRKNLFRIVLN